MPLQIHLALAQWTQSSELLPHGSGVRIPQAGPSLVWTQAFQDHACAPTQALHEFLFTQGAFFAVAFTAGHLQILIGGLTTPRFGDNMVQVYFRGLQILPTKHASRTIALDHSASDIGGYAGVAHDNAYL